MMSHPGLTMKLNQMEKRKYYHMLEVCFEMLQNFLKIEKGFLKDREDGMMSILHTLEES